MSMWEVDDNLLVFEYIVYKVVMENSVMFKDVLVGIVKDLSGFLVDLSFKVLVYFNGEDLGIGLFVVYVGSLDNKVDVVVEGLGYVLVGGMLIV